RRLNHLRTLGAEVNNDSVLYRILARVERKSFRRRIPSLRITTDEGIRLDLRRMMSIRVPKARRVIRNLVVVNCRLCQKVWRTREIDTVDRGVETYLCYRAKARI